MRANSQQVGFCFRHTFIYSLFCNICFISYSQKCAFFAIYSSIRRLQWFQRGWQRPNARRRGRERKKGEKRKLGRKRWRKAKEGKERKGKDRKESERRKRGKRRVNGAREKGREGEGEGASEGERALLASVVHVARALYMNVTQDVAVGLSCILCTTTFDYTEYHARLRSIRRNTMHTFARLSRIPCTTPTDSSISGLRFGPICSIFYENSK